MVRFTKAIYAQSRPQGTLGQKTELIALTQVQWENNQAVNTYTTMPLPLHMPMVPGAETAVLIRKGDKKEEISVLETTISLQEMLAIIHCPGHPKRISVEA